VFGFRYGNINKKSKSQKKVVAPLLEKMEKTTSSQVEVGGEKVEVGHVQMYNGVHLSLDPGQNILNKYGDTLSFKQRSKAVKDIARIQGYYDIVKDHLRSKSKKDKIIIKYKRMQMLREH
jgi:hypothetical protein